MPGRIDRSLFSKGTDISMREIEEVRRLKSVLRAQVQQAKARKLAKKNPTI